MKMNQKEDMFGKCLENKDTSNYRLRSFVELKYKLWLP
jgi:hypothetical protein